MFRAEPLVRIRLHMLASEAPDAALELARFGIFSPSQYASEALTESPAEAYREAWLEAESRVSKLLERCGNMLICARDSIWNTPTVSAAWIMA